MGAEGRQQERHDDGEAAGSLRRCILTRVERDPADLLRFVADPEGRLVPDLSRKLPGRGVWVTADKASVAAAAETRAFAKSLKRAVTVALDLPQTVEALFVKRALEALSLANKAGLVTTGFEKVETLISGGRAAALLQGADAAEDGKRKLNRKFAAVQRDSGKAAPIVDWLTIEQLSLAIGRSNVVHAAVKQGGATQRFLLEAERLRRYRSGFGAS